MTADHRFEDWEEERERMHEDARIEALEAECRSDREWEKADWRTFEIWGA
jgi:hypothetical protein